MSEETESELRPLMHWLLARYPETPRSRAKQWILAGRVRVRGEVIRKPHLPLTNPGRHLELLDRSAKALDCESGWQIHPRVNLLFLDSAVAVVDKSPGLVSVPAPNCELSALSILADYLVGRLKPRDRAVAARVLPSSFRRLVPLPVHRLDQYTSGVFCMAMNPAARAELIEQLKAHTMKREYVAFVEGKPPRRTGTWRDWLALSEDGLRQRVVSSSSAAGAESDVQEAITHYEVIAEYHSGNNVYSKLVLRLETGRKHQIRVQAAHVGLPLIGDRTYNAGYRPGTGASASVAFPRQALHSHKLTLEHPDHKGRQVSWTAELPKDLRQLEAALRRPQL